jgi:UDP-2,3-diacylglucosamine hydrolase
MADLVIEQSAGKKIYFASDFHLGLSASSIQKEFEREKKIISWLNSIEADAQAIFLVGDVFDFWYEYKHAIPKGFSRFIGKIASLSDNGIDVYFFTGNHDLWMFEYLQSELNIAVFTNPIELRIDEKKLFVGHGDGLGPGDRFYKILKKIFISPIPQWMFRWLHPDIGIALAKRWSKNSRLSKAKMDGESLGEKEFLIQFCKAKEKHAHHDYYIFGHRHLAVEVDINEKSKYYNLGEWVKACTYGVFDQGRFELKSFSAKP